MIIVDKAYRFARKVHKGQLYNSKPFYMHCAQVAKIVKNLFPLDYELITAAYLHDTIEDTNVSPALLTEEFGAGVASLVFEVTKDENKNFPNIKTIRGLILKTADRLANVSNLEGMVNIEKQNKLFKKYSNCPIHEGSHRSE